MGLAGGRSLFLLGLSSDGLKSPIAFKRSVVHSFLTVWCYTWPREWAARDERCTCQCSTEAVGNSIREWEKAALTSDSHYAVLCLQEIIKRCSLTWTFVLNSKLTGPLAFRGVFFSLGRVLTCQNFGGAGVIRQGRVMEAITVGKAEKPSSSDLITLSELLSSSNQFTTSKKWYWRISPRHKPDWIEGVQRPSTHVHTRLVQTSHFDL